MENSLADGTSIDYFEKYQVDSKKSPLGYGINGVVFEGSFPGSKEKIAMKVVQKDAQGIPSATLREIALLRSIDHPNIVRLLKVEQDEKYTYSIFEHLDYSLAYVIREGMDPKNVKMFMRHMLSAIEYCHARNIMHRDLKPDNMMINAERNVLKVVDFGLARVHDVGLRKLTPERMPMLYRAPEILMGAPYSCSCDIWSVGCIFVEMVNVDPPFISLSGESKITCIFKKLGTPTEQSWPGVTTFPDFPRDNSFFRPQGWSELSACLDEQGLDLLSKLLVLNPKERISASDALKHPYFQEL